MEDILSGSVNQPLSMNEKSGPLDQAKENALKFIFGMQQLSTFKTITERIELIESLKNLPLLQSGSFKNSEQVLQEYNKEIQELETAIIIFCSLPDTPEA